GHESLATPACVLARSTAPTPAGATYCPASTVAAAAHARATIPPTVSPTGWQPAPAGLPSSASTTYTYCPPALDCSSSQVVTSSDGETDGRERASEQVSPCVSS